MLLKVLMESAGRIKTREQIRSQFVRLGVKKWPVMRWRCDISNLRKKLPKDFIKTVRGVGYSVSAQ